MAFIALGPNSGFMLLTLPGLRDLVVSTERQINFNGCQKTKIDKEHHLSWLFKSFKEVLEQLERESNLCRVH